jgi:acetyl esterase/lipase
MRDSVMSLSLVANDLPIVVLLHGGGLDKSEAIYGKVGRALADRGVVTVVPNWGPASGTPPETDTVAAVSADIDTLACALSFIVANGSEWGADPTRIVLFGHSGGANMASVLMFTYSRSVGDGCAATAQQWQPQAVVLWDGELGLLDQSLWANYAAVLPELFAVSTPWLLVAPAIYDGPVHLLVTASFRDSAKNCDDLATWTAARDPSGNFRAALDAVGAASDGCVDIGEVHQALRQYLTGAGIPTDYEEFTEGGSYHLGPAPADFTRLIDLLTTWATATVSGLPG